MSYKVIQMTNNSIGAVTANRLMPFGVITRKINCKDYDSAPFSVSTTGANTVSINETGYYKITYNATLTSTAEATVTTSLLVNEVNTYTVSQAADEIGSLVKLTLVYEIRVCPNSPCNPTNLPVNIQIQLGSTAISAGTSNLLIEKVY